MTREKHHLALKNAKLRKGRAWWCCARMIAFLLLICCAHASAQATPSSLQTKAPPPYNPYGSPVHELHKDGIALAPWMERFVSCANQLAIPIEDGGFVKTSDGYITENKGTPSEKDCRYTTYRVMIGDCELFVRTFEDAVITDIYVYLDYSHEEDITMVQQHYFAQVLRACVYACEEGSVRDGEIHAIVNALCTGLDESVADSRALQNTLIHSWPEYEVHHIVRNWGKSLRFFVGWS